MSTRTLAVLTAGVLTLGLAACGGDDQDSADPSMTVSVSQDGPAVEGITDDMRNNRSVTTGPDDVTGPVPVVTVPFLASTPRVGSNSFTFTCPFGGRADIATPVGSSRIVREDADYDFELIPSDRPLTLLAPAGETSVIQITPDMDTCQVRIDAGAGVSMGDFTVDQRTIFAISTPRD